MNERRQMPELGEDEAALLGAYRAETEMPPELGARVWDRLEAPAPVGLEAAGWSVRGVVVGMLAAAAVIGLWIGAQQLRTSPTRAPAEQAGYQHGGNGSPEAATPREPDAAASKSDTAGSTALPERAPSPDTSAPSIVPGPTDDAAPTGASSGSPAPASNRAPSRRSPASTSTPEPAPTDRLAEENRVLSRARKALLDHAPERALEHLRDHARRFPRGVLSPERQALRAIALCEAGREIEGTAAARGFLRAHPQATLAARVRTVCLK
ncbi:MAG: hypothetical protein AAF799_44285 [Myxococcota bacterium]